VGVVAWPASTTAYARPPRLRIGLWEFLPKNGGYETLWRWDLLTMEVVGSGLSNMPVHFSATGGSFSPPQSGMAWGAASYFTDGRSMCATEACGMGRIR
jgi:hypothetical protein